MAFLLGFSALYWAVVAVLVMVEVFLGVPGLLIWAAMIYVFVMWRSIRATHR